MTLDEAEYMLGKRIRMQAAREEFHRTDELQRDREVRLRAEEWWTTEQLWADTMASFDDDDDDDYYYEKNHRLDGIIGLIVDCRWHGRHR